MKIKLVVCDLDGSLLNSNSEISPADQLTLKELGESGVIRVIATGRNLFSTRKVIDHTPLIDYAAISTGLGILNFQTGEILKTEHLDKEQVRFLVDFMIKEKVDFMIHNLLPDNHYVTCYDADTGHPDFLLRWGWYRKFASNYDHNPGNLEPASQFISFHPPSSPRIDQIRKELKDFHIVRTTSPITNHYDWMEIFPPNVSKGHALQWLCKYLNIDINYTICLGNDYNDLDMLQVAGNSFVTSNAPKDLKEIFNVTVSNNEDPLTKIIDKIKIL